MKQDKIVSFYVFATIFGCSYCGTSLAAFRSSHSTSAAQSAAAASTTLKNSAIAKKQLSHIAVGLKGYPSMATDTMYVPPIGSISYGPHDADNINERPVYDPGDELLRALNAKAFVSGNELGTLPEEPDYADTVYNEMEVASNYDILRELEDDFYEEQDAVNKYKILLKFLEDPTVDTLPLAYVEPAEESLNSDEDTNDFNYSLSSNGIKKRSRYYRRYPWKRHNRNRSNYEPELRYACNPSKEDVFKLLVSLHENRKGNHQRTVQFCNRKRPAKAIFTNIRFLG